MGFVVAAHALWCLWWVLSGSTQDAGRRWRRPALGFGLTAGFTLALHTPLLADLGRFFTAPPTQGGRVATRGWTLLEAVRGLEIGLGTVGVALVGLLLVAGLWSYLRRDPQSFTLFVLPGLLTLAGTILMQRPTYPRFFFFLIGFGSLAIVRGASVVWSRRDGSASRVGAVLVGAVIVLSAVSLGAGYRYPQDFEGALRFLETARGSGDLVGVTGTAAFPYLRYFDRRWEEVESAAQLAAMRGRAPRVWMVYTFPAYIEADTPELMAAIRKECTLRRRFRGTVGAGDVVVCALPGVAPGARQP